MGGKPDSLPDHPPSFNDVEEKKDEDGGMKVFCVTDNKGGKVNMKQLDIEVDGKGLLDKKLLEEHDNDVLMVDTGTICYVWTGLGASRDEREFAMPVILERDEYARRPFRRMCQKKETKKFMKLFA